MNPLITKNTCHNKLEESLIPLFKNPNDVTIRITKTTICAVDVHISKGDIPEVMEHLILKHKGSIEYDEDESSFSVLSVNNKAIITYHRLRNL